MEYRNKDYKTKEWKKLREEVLKLDHYQCTRCGRIFSKKDIETGYTKKRSDTPVIHHNFEKEKYPEYKYDIWVKVSETADSEKIVRNLVTLCFDCHEIIHKRKWHEKASEGYRNEERFD